MEPEQKSNGALIGLIIIIIILILGGIYLWNQNKKTSPEPAIETSQTTGENENTAEMEANLNGLDLESLDSDI